MKDELVSMHMCKIIKKQLKLLTNIVKNKMMRNSGKHWLS